MGYLESSRFPDGQVGKSLFVKGYLASGHASHQNFIRWAKLSATCRNSLLPQLESTNMVSSFHSGRTRLFDFMCCKNVLPQWHPSFSVDGFSWHKPKLCGGIWWQCCSSFSFCHNNARRKKEYKYWNESFLIGAINKSCPLQNRTYCSQFKDSSSFPEIVWLGSSIAHHTCDQHFW